MMHIVKLIERRFPTLADSILQILVIAALLLLLSGIIVALLR